MISDLCINIQRHQRLVISKMKEMIKKKKKNKTKMTTNAKEEEKMTSTLM